MCERTFIVCCLVLELLQLELNNEWVSLQLSALEQSWASCWPLWEWALYLCLW